MSFTIRDAIASDVPALAHLHVRTYNETHAAESMDGPTYAIREYQWRRAFQYREKFWFRLVIDRGKPWFCFVIENQNGELVGFAKGQRYASHDQPDFSGELNKIYVLREYHRRGLGRRLVGHVARRFLSQGISSMLLFGDAHSPSNRFYEALGGAKLLAANGAFHGGYGWRDLRELAKVCPID
jgi:ribosomal protein S18 acetylase RimI-like enzyme